MTVKQGVTMMYQLFVLRSDDTAQPQIDLFKLLMQNYMYEMGKYDVIAAGIMKKKPHEVDPIYADYGLNADGLITNDPWESGFFKNSYIPENPRSPKPLTFSNNRLWRAKNCSNTSGVAILFFRKKVLFFQKLCICAISFFAYIVGSFQNSYLPENPRTPPLFDTILYLPTHYFFQKTDFGTPQNIHNHANSLKINSEKTIFFFKFCIFATFFWHIRNFFLMRFFLNFSNKTL
ncbi:hypothetical protein LXL04_028731 [Taraxacum kok-saghyz]